MRVQGGSSGFTLLELMIGLVFTSVLMLALTDITQRSGDAYQTVSNHTLSEVALQRALERVVKVLQAGSSDTFTPDPTNALGASDLQFRQALDLDAAGVTWSDPSSLTLEYEPGEIDDGVDGDGDGRIDEMQLVLTTGIGTAAPRRRVLISGLAELASDEAANGLDDDGDGVVDEGGFNIRRQGDLLLIQMTRLVADSGQTVDSVQIETTIRVRN